MGQIAWKARDHRWKHTIQQRKGTLADPQKQVLLPV